MWWRWIGTEPRCANWAIVSYMPTPTAEYVRSITGIFSGHRKGWALTRCGAVVVSSRPRSRSDSATRAKFNW